MEKKNVPTVRLAKSDWEVCESLSGRSFNFSARVSVRFSEADYANGEIVNAAKCTPGLSLNMTDAVKMSLHWWAENKDAHPVYYVTFSQLLRDALALYAKELSPKVLREELISSPVPASSEAFTVGLGAENALV